MSSTKLSHAQAQLPQYTQHTGAYQRYLWLCGIARRFRLGGRMQETTSPDWRYQYVQRTADVPGGSGGAWPQIRGPTLIHDHQAFAAENEIPIRPKSVLLRLIN